MHLPLASSDHHDAFSVHIYNTCTGLGPSLFDCLPVGGSNYPNIFNLDTGRIPSEFAFLLDAALSFDLSSVAPTATPGTMVSQHDYSHTGENRQPSPTASQPDKCSLAGVAVVRLRRNAVFVPRMVTDAILDTYATGNAVYADANCSNQAIKPATGNCGNDVAKYGVDESKKSCPKGYSAQVNHELSVWTRKNNNPYPSLQEKLKLMKTTGLTKMQLKNWFCNYRRRKMPSTIRRPKAEKSSRRR
ncbi:hypothetical protein EV174_005236 [Coemansia sp. RSA 2320]|nr:hypothetical protein EV174_005236 [Coemansia sp. RSA 2320]